MPRRPWGCSSSGRHRSTTGAGGFAPKPCAHWGSFVRRPASTGCSVRSTIAHEEVRAAAVDALGRIGDPRCGPALLARLGDESRHQRARVVEAIRALGPSITPVLLAHAREQPARPCHDSRHPRYRRGHASDRESSGVEHP